MLHLIILGWLIYSTGIENVMGKDIGKLSHTFKVDEEPFIKMMKRKLQEVDIEKEQEKMRTIAKDQVQNPKAVVGISKALENRTIYVNPTYTLDEDVVLPCGKILHKAGTKVNPLENMDLNRRLFFVDGREDEQIEWLEDQMQNLPPDQKERVEDRIILIGGSVFDLQKKLKKEHKGKVYFDQNGELTSKFGIKHVPAIAGQEGLKIRIDEISLKN